ncbi:MAG: hypothetical protein IVW57_15235 [Ktedonobacterales bacterium]|nr:hypothetical protein [Ktedonobacterales bacterium]
MTISKATLYWLLWQLEQSPTWSLPDGSLTITRYTLGREDVWTADWGADRVDKAPSLVEALLAIPDTLLVALATYPKG